MKTPLAMEARMYWICARALRAGRLDEMTPDTLDDTADELDVLGQNSDYEQIQDRCIEAVNSYAARHTVVAQVARA